jgi:hypothetical protein
LQIDPFHFDADISGSVALMAGSDTLMSVGLDASLSGPAPWHIAGDFKVHILFFDVHKSFSYTWGESTPATPIAPVQVIPLLTAAFADSRNWGTQLPANVPSLVSLRSQNGTTVVAHPLAQLEVHESIAPLGLQITRFGAAPISGATLFNITDFQVNGTTVWTQTTPVLDDFAPAQFFDLTDQEKLEGPSFEQHNAGVCFNSGPAVSGASLSKAITYETWYVDESGGVPRSDSPAAPQQLLTLLDLSLTLKFGASARAEVRKSGKLRFQAPGKGISVSPQTFSVASTTTLASAGLAPAGGVTYSAARALLAQAAASKPGSGLQLQIVATHELAAS